MPKMKTHRGAAKRLRKTGSGKIVRRKAFASHILTKKTKKRKRRLMKTVVVSSASARGLRGMLPYA
jgi:large subunit ribosomal protein L35